MTQENSYHRPRLIINEKEILFDISGSLSYDSNGSISTLEVTIESVDMQIDALFNKKVKLYLNEGSEDSVPAFTGYIKQIKPNEKNIKISALDVRSHLVDARVTLTDSTNYDGYTIGQFLQAYITDYINVNETLIGLDMLKDVNPPVYMTGRRGNNLKVYELIRSVIDGAIDDDDIENPLNYFVDIYEDGTDSNITIVKDKLLTNTPSYTFSFSDGLQNYKGNKRNPANTAFFEGGYFAYGSRPTGISTTNIAKQEDSKKTRELALKQILLEQQQKEEISINVSKGKDIALGSIIYIDVDDDDIRGSHRVVSKKLSFGNTFNCNLKLNKKPPILDSYLSP